VVRASCHTGNDRSDCGTFRFVRVRRLTQGAWNFARDVSYGH